MEQNQVMVLLQEIKGQLKALDAKVEALCKSPPSTSFPLKVGSPEFVVS